MAYIIAVNVGIQVPQLSSITDSQRRPSLPKVEQHAFVQTQSIRLVPTIQNMKDA